MVINMFEEFKFKSELHAHTTPASGCSQITPEYMVEVYKNKGYDSVAITNHFLYTENEDAEEKINKYLDDYYKTAELGEKVGLNVILGSEIRFSENNNDYLIYGICPEDLYEINSLLGDGIDNFYKKYKNNRNIIIQAHPFRDNIVLANPESIDGVEAFNMHPGHNSRIGFAAQYAKEHDFIIMTGTDYHHFGHEGLCSILTKEPVCDSYKLAEILKSGDYLIDIGGYKVLPRQQM